MSYRNQFDEGALKAIQEVFDFYGEEDFGYQGEFEDRYTSAFVKYQGGKGYADAVCSGTAALYVALAALQLQEGSHVLVSPITDPGTISAIVLNKLVPVVIDSMPCSYNIGVEQFLSRITDKTKALVVVHAGGKAAPIQEISKEAKLRGIYIVEDCSQAHGAECDRQKVGTFGDIAAFSTMYRKSHSTGGCGGVVYTTNQKLYNLVRAYADRGKTFSEPNFDEKNPDTFLFPALNLNQDELSCALGCYTLKKLDSVRSKRLSFLSKLDFELKSKSNFCSLFPYSNQDSPFYWQVGFDRKNNICAKTFADRVKAKGIGINSHYNYIVSKWGWFDQFAYDDFIPSNALECVERSFNILFHESHSLDDAQRYADTIIETERSLWA